MENKVTLDLEEYDYLKWCEHEYHNLSDELEDLINNADVNRYSKTIYINSRETEKINTILKRYLQEAYDYRIGEGGKDE